MRHLSSYHTLYLGCKPYTSDMYTLLVSISLSYLEISKGILLVLLGPIKEVWVHQGHPPWRFSDYW